MSGKVLRCKMRVNTVKQNIDASGKAEQEEVSLVAVTSGGESSENAQWARWTPSANFTIYINNPAAFNQLSKGHEFYVDFIPVEESTPNF